MTRTENLNSGSNPAFSWVSSRVHAVVDTISYNTLVQTELAYNTLASLSFYLAQSSLTPEMTGARVAMIFAWSLGVFAPSTAYYLRYYSNEKSRLDAISNGAGTYLQTETTSAYHHLSEALITGKPQLPFTREYVLTQKHDGIPPRRSGLRRYNRTPVSR